MHAACPNCNPVYAAWLLVLPAVNVSPSGQQANDADQDCQVMIAGRDHGKHDQQQ